MPTYLKNRGRVAANLVFTGVLLLCLFFFQGLFAGLDTWLADLWLAARLKINSSSAGNLAFLRRFTPVPPVNPEITVVLIDDRSILGIQGLYQGNREIYAGALQQLNRHGPKAVGLDVFFAAASDETPEIDEEFVEAAKASGKIVVRAFRRDDRRMTPPFPALARATVAAPSYFRQFRDEAIRAVSVAFTNEREETVLSFQTEIMRLFYGLQPDQVETAGNELIFKLPAGEMRVPLLNGEYMLLNYDIPGRSFRTFSFYDLYHGNIPAEALKDRIVIIGAASSMTEEKLYTPVSGNEFSPFMNAVAIRNLLGRSWLVPSPTWPGLVLAAALALVMMFLLLNHLQLFGSLLLTSATIATLLCYSFISLTLYGKPADVSAAILAVAASFMFSIGHRYYLELSEKMRIKTAFQHYVTASVVNEILKNPAKLNLHGEERNLTIFFSDIEGFTALSEGMSPLDVVSLLNEYLTAMTDIIFKFDGLLDKYEGDAIMAVFGAPVDQKDHAIRACRCALENQRALKKLREKWKQEGKPEIRARIGINTGIVVVGNMGSTMRFDYTVIGDNVNLAARLETGNKLFGTEILVSEETATLAESVIISRCLAKLKVAGKTNLVNVYEVLADRNDPDRAVITLAERARDAYHAASAELLNRNFPAAEQILQAYLAENPGDHPAKALHSKVKGFMIVPPPPGWENIVTQDIK